MKGKPGRHAPAFVLLELYKGPSYGLQILNNLKDNMPMCCLDSAAVYRALNTLEKNECITSHWETEESGAPKKIYTITDKGREEMRLFYEDITRRIENLKYFMNSYEAMEEKKND